jgi:hypothetical protein
MKFPDYSGKNLDALDEMLNDLEWIEEQKVIIYIDHSSEWLSKEKSEEKILSVIDIFDATAEDWKWLDEEEEGIAKKELQIVFQDSERIRALLEDQEIPFDMQWIKNGHYRSQEWSLMVKSGIVIFFSHDMS